MSRRARIIFPNLPHHITQRGNRKQKVFFTDDDRNFYLDCLQEQCQKFNVSILAYCLMSNHVHHALVPSDEYGMHKALKSIHSKYAYRINQRYGWQGHLWQSRFHSSPFDRESLKVVIGYIESNPVRAGMVHEAEDYSWSSAQNRIYGKRDPLLDSSLEWSKFLPSGSSWKIYLTQRNDNSFREIRDTNKQNLPYGSLNFIHSLESTAGRSLRVRGRGRPSTKR